MAYLGKVYYNYENNNLYYMSARKSFSYKGVRTNMFGLPFFDEKKDLSRRGKKQIKGFHHYSFVSELEKTAPKNLVVMYDIPSDKKKEREWFRRHLRKFNFEMIQKSVWVGPSPLPRDFLDYVKSIGLGNKLKAFKLAKPYTGEGNGI